MMNVYIDPNEPESGLWDYCDVILNPVSDQLKKMNYKLRSREYNSEEDTIVIYFDHDQKVADILLKIEYDPILEKKDKDDLCVVSTLFTTIDVEETEMQRKMKLFGVLYLNDVTICETVSSDNNIFEIPTNEVIDTHFDKDNLLNVLDIYIKTFDSKVFDEYMLDVFENGFQAVFGKFGERGIFKSNDDARQWLGNMIEEQIDEYVVDHEIEELYPQEILNTFIF